MSWLLYAFVLSAILTAAARALEWSAGALRLPTRWIWAGAMGATCFLTLAAATGLLTSPPTAESSPEQAATALSLLSNQTTSSPASARGAHVEPAAGLLESAFASIQAGLRTVDKTLARLARWVDAFIPGPPVLLWSLVGALFFLYLLVGWRAMHARRRQWARAVVLGEPVRVARTLGPAAIGVRRPEIVLPRRLLDLPLPALRIVLRHEREHLEGGDTRLLAAGLLLLLLMPWNPFMWLQHARLRDGVEVDCDTRVLQGLRISPRQYAQTLMEVGIDRFPGLTPAPALRGPLSQLERRIRSMRPQPIFRRIPAVLLGTLLAVGLFLVACEVEPPSAFEESLEVTDGDQTGEANLDEPPADHRPAPVQVFAEPGPDGVPRPIGWMAALRKEDGSIVPGVFRGPRALLDELTDGTLVLESDVARFVPRGEGISQVIRLDEVAGARIPSFFKDGEPVYTVATYFEGREPSPIVASLYVLDGVAMSEEDLPELETGEVTRIEFIRGAEATERFGDRAAGGVMIIETVLGDTGAEDDNRR